MFSKLFGGPAIIVSNAFYRTTVSRFFERGIKYVTSEYDKNEDTLEIYESTFTDDACPFIEQNYNFETHGIKNMECADILNGFVKKVSLPIYYFSNLFRGFSLHLQVASQP